MKTFNIYCDESCHLEHDGFNVMCIGYIKVNTELYQQVQKDLKMLKLKYQTPTELKWNKLSFSRLDFYKALIDYFFVQDALCFRSILVKYKNDLRHEDFNQGNHDNFYYKLIYFLLRPNHETDSTYRVFLDIKDTKGKERLTKINEIFANYHRGNSPFTSFQHLHSHDNILIELADFFIGAITYKSRNLNSSKVKNMVIEYLEYKSGYYLNEGTEPWETKFNIFDHQPKRSRNV